MSSVHRTPRFNRCRRLSYDCQITVSRPNVFALHLTRETPARSNLWVRAPPPWPGQDGLLDCLIVASDVHMKQREDTYVETREDNNHKDGLFRKAILQGLIMFYLGCLGLILLYRRYECGVLRRFCAGFRRGSRRGIGLTLSVR